MATLKAVCILVGAEVKGVVNLEQKVNMDRIRDEYPRNLSVCFDVVRPGLAWPTNQDNYATE